jgi:serine/threonine protein kinase
VIILSLFIGIRLHAHRPLLPRARPRLLNASPPSHPAVPRLDDFFFDAHGRIEVALELCAGGELFDWVAARDEGLTEGEARGVFRQVAAGVAHLHGLGIAHRDLKPQNLMYVADPAGGAGAVKIVDYDLAKARCARVAVLWDSLQYLQHCGTRGRGAVSGQRAFIAISTSSSASPNRPGAGQPRA